MLVTESKSRKVQVPAVKKDLSPVYNFSHSFLFLEEELPGVHRSESNFEYHHVTILQVNYGKSKGIHIFRYRSSQLTLQVVHDKVNAGII